MMLKTREYKHITIKYYRANLYTVHKKTDDADDFIGCLEWYPLWKQYVLTPPSTGSEVYSWESLRDISEFLKELNKDRDKT